MRSLLLVVLFFAVPNFVFGEELPLAKDAKTQTDLVLAKKAKDRQERFISEVIVSVRSAIANGEYVAEIECFHQSNDTIEKVKKLLTSAGYLFEIVSGKTSNGYFYSTLKIWWN